MSPHSDDICFSLGIYITKRKKGRLLTVFSRSNCVNSGATIDKHGLSSLPEDARIVSVSRIRQREDECFAALTGLEYSTCGLAEAPVRGRDAFSAVTLAEDTQRFAPRIMQHIYSLFPWEGISAMPTLYCPTAIGGHLDHLVVRNTIIDNILELRTMYQVVFYEDLYYASDLDARQRGLAEFFDKVEPFRIRRKAITVRDRDRKLGLLDIYTSQFVTQPLSLTQFTPAIGIPFNPLFNPVHEAIWLV